MTMTIGDAVGSLLKDGLPGRSRRTTAARSAPARSTSPLRLKNQRGLAYLLTAPGDLGLARAYVSGDLDIEGVHPGDPYDALTLLYRTPQVPRADAGRGAADRARPGLVQPQAAARAAAGDAAALAPHRRGPAPLDGPGRRGDPPPLRRVQPLLRDGAGSVDDLHLRGVPHRGRHPRGGAGLQVRPGRRASSTSSPACGCSTSGAAGAAWSASPPASTASRRSARRCRCCRRRGPRRPSTARAWPTSPRCGTPTTATCSRPTSTRSAPSGSPSTSACGSTPPTSGSSSDKLRPQGRLLNHCITRPHNRRQETGAFIDRYVFPDGELTGVGRIITEAQNVGLEVMHAENFRMHYAKTLRRLVPEPRRQLGRVRGRGRRGHRAGVGPVHGGLADGLREQRDPARPRARGAAPTRRRRRVPAALHLGLTRVAGGRGGRAATGSRPRAATAETR